MTKHARLWDKGRPLDAIVHRFTVGDDPQLDRALIHWDCLGSAAHVAALRDIGLLSQDEAQTLVNGLTEIDRLHADGKFDIPPELEDGHTAIEAHLTARLGAVGEKLHAGRSRNDQVATAMRLWMRSALLDQLALSRDFAATLLDRITQDAAIAMPGYTHLQRAMPSSAGQWLHAVFEATLENLLAGLSLFERLDSCPLGAGAGYGVPLPLDRAATARRLGFSHVQRSPIDVQNSRGRYELLLTRFAGDLASTLEKLASDLVLFSTAEFGFVDLPEEMTTGSSIMPQKRNPDALELLRGRAGRVRARATELEWVCGKLTSGYHRDLQLTKGPVMAADADIRDMLIVAGRCIVALRWKPDRMRAAMSPELYATHAALERAASGVPFRQAYREVAGALRDGSFTIPASVRAEMENPAHETNPTATEFAALTDTLRGELKGVAKRIATLESRIRAAEDALLPSA